jgi:hypothetical protein
MAPGIGPKVTRCALCGITAVTWQTPAAAVGRRQRFCVACINRAGWLAVLRHLRPAQ